MLFPHLLFRQAGLNPTDVAGLCRVSRISGYRWLLGVDRRGQPGVGVNIFLQDRVERVAVPLALAVKAGVLPDPSIAKLTPAKRLVKLRGILRQFSQTK